MTEDSDGAAWPPAMMKAFQEAGEQAMEGQQQFLRAMFGTGANLPTPASQMGAMTRMATFKTRVQSGGRISIPDAEREALDIGEGDIVQTVVVPVKRTTEQTDD